MSAIKFSVLNLTANLKGKQVKFKKANLTSNSRQIRLCFLEIKLRRRAKFTIKFDESELVLLRSHLLGGRHFWQSRHQHRRSANRHDKARSAAYLKRANFKAKALRSS